MSNKTKEFVEKAILVHGNKYRYDKTIYQHSMQPLIITCAIHGDFSIRPNNHLSSKQGCQKCSKRYKPSTNEFISQAKAIHGSKYDYTHVIYVNNKTPIELICFDHGSFFPLPRDFIHKKSGCPACANKKRGAYHKKDTNWFIETAQTIHGDKYDYTRVVYQRYHNKVEILCPEHGLFYQTAGGHISQKQGCPTCSVKNYQGGYGKKRFENFPDLKTKNGKLYVVQCYNLEESFIKIGITQFEINHRLNKGRLPYDYNVIHTFDDQMYRLFLLEQQIKKQFKTFKYRP